MSTTAKSKRAQQSWRDVLPVHPACGLFPMLPESELRELGEDIKKNGLKSRIVLWSPGAQTDKDQPTLLLDGRNRLDAMELVGLPTVNDGKLVPLDVSKRVAAHIFSVSTNSQSFTACRLAAAA
jgi:hypothetical protein